MASTSRSPAADAHPAASVVLRLVADRPGAVYACGEAARVTVTAEPDDGSVAEVAVRFIRDFRTEAGTLDLTLENGRASFVRTLDEPGFLVIQVQPGDTAHMKLPSVYALPGPKLTVAFSPERITPAMDEPADFGAFFARRIRVPTLMSVGFRDATCPPSSVYAAFNGIPAAKQMVHQIDRGHEMGLPAFGVQCDTVWLPEALGLKAVP